MNLQDLQKNFPEAYDALPEAYKADSCLEFYLVNGSLCCAPLENQIQALGAWECVWTGKVWYNIEPSAERILK